MWQCGPCVAVLFKHSLFSLVLLYLCLQCWDLVSKNKNTSRDYPRKESRCPPPIPSYPNFLSCPQLNALCSLIYHIAGNIRGVHISFFLFSVYQNESLTQETYVMMGLWLHKAQTPLTHWHQKMFLFQHTSYLYLPWSKAGPLNLACKKCSRQPQFNWLVD